MDGDKQNEAIRNGETPATSALATLGVFGNVSKVKMSFDPQTPEGAVKLVQAQLQELPGLEELNGKKIQLTAYMYHPAQTVDPDTAEVKEFRRIIVWDANGTAWDCGSQGVDKSLAIIETICGPGPWNPPVECEVVSRRLPSKRMWLTLNPNTDKLMARLKGKK